MSNLPFGASRRQINDFWGAQPYELHGIEETDKRTRQQNIDQLLFLFPG
jgi:hypothetical protein